MRARKPAAGRRLEGAAAARRLLLRLTLVAAVVLAAARLLRRRGGSLSGADLLDWPPRVPAAEPSADAAAAAAAAAWASGPGSEPVEFTVPGLRVPMRAALDLALPLQPGEEALVLSDPRLLDGDPLARPPRVLVAVATACCSRLAHARRAAIRQTWASPAALEPLRGRVDVRFFVAQARDVAQADAWAPALAAEQAAHGDLVALRGRDHYRRLPNKVVRALRYALARPDNYTHVLKADDDTWVSLARLRSKLAQPRFAARAYLGSAIEFQLSMLTASKWHMPEGVLPASSLPQGLHYAEGFGYALSRDVAAAAVAAVNGWERGEEPTPPWFRALYHTALEDILMGLVVRTRVEGVDATWQFAFRHPWKACRAGSTVVRHLDVDSPARLAAFDAAERGNRTGAERFCTSAPYTLWVGREWAGYDAWRRALPPLRGAGDDLPPDTAGV